MGVSIVLVTQMLKQLDMSKVIDRMHSVQIYSMYSVIIILKSL